MVSFAAFPVAAKALFGLFATSRAASEAAPLHDPEVALDPARVASTDSGLLTDGSALVPGFGGAGAYASAAVSSGNGKISLYQVREGDSLSEIADMFGISVNTILWANEIKDAKTIRPGDVLLILPVSGVQYTVKRGGTLADVAKLFDADVDEIALFNGIDPSAPLAAGTELIIPGGNLAPARTSTASSGSAAAASASVPARALPALSGYFGNPLPGGVLTQGIHGTNGVDVGAPNGTPVYAAAAGAVIVARSGGYNGGYGNYVVVSHDNGTQTLYAHLSSVSVSMGQAVEKGTKLGGVGNTGRSTGYHLHFEVRGAKNPLAQ